MGNFLPLLILLAIVSFVSSAGNRNKKSAPANRPAARQTPAPAAKPAPKPQPASVPGQPEPDYFEQAQQTVHRGKDGALHPTERTDPAAVSSPHDGVFEGDDPCHAYMLEDVQLPACEDADEEAPQPGRPAFDLAFTKDRMVNAVVMSEILNRRVPRKRAG